MSYLKDLLKIIFSLVIAMITPLSKQLWLISERGSDARDNGYWFFKYVNQFHPEIQSYYCIARNSADYDKVSNIGKIITYNSLFHGIQYFRATALISTHAYLCAPNWHGIGKISQILSFSLKAKKVFLQHGIIKDMIPGITADNLALDLFICGAKPEYEYILHNYGFSSNVVKYTGLARFDNLSSQKDIYYNERLILLMPTWRVQFRGISKEEFKKTQYFKMYNSLINNSELIDFLEETDQNVIFYPHYEVQKFIDCFSSKSSRIIIAKFKDYDVQQLLLRCNKLITDYSSVFFDIAYLKKTIIFFQFDYKSYRYNQYQEGYFDYNHSFGPVIETINGIVDYLRELQDNGVSQLYQDRENDFFKIHDSNNCERIYNEVVKMIAKK